MRVCKHVKKDFFAVIFSIIILFALINISGCNIISEQPNEVENHPPNIISEPLKIAYVGEEYTYNVDAYDVEGDVLIYSLNIKPQGMEIDSSSGSISWTPLLNQLVENKRIKANKKIKCNHL